MAHAETIAFGSCPHCGGQVAIKVNRSNLAYCRCDHCGVEVRHHWHKTSDAFIAKFAPQEEPKKPAAPAAAPAPAAVKPQQKSIVSTLLG